MSGCQTLKECMAQQAGGSAMGSHGWGMPYAGAGPLPYTWGQPIPEGLAGLLSDPRVAGLLGSGVLNSWSSPWLQSVIGG